MMKRTLIDSRLGQLALLHGLAICSLLCSVGLAQSPQVRIMPLGDSITRGANDVNYPISNVPGGYRKELGNQLSNAGIAFDFVGSSTQTPADGMDPDHEGHDGFRSDQILAQLPTWLSAAPDVVLLHLGTNDILQNISLNTVAANLNSVIHAITLNAPARRLYVATVVPITQAWPPQQKTYSAAYLNGNVNTYNVQVRSIVNQQAALGRRVYLVEMNGGIVLDHSTPTLDFFQPGDGVHPGQAGYDQMGVIWANAVISGPPLFPPPLLGTPLAPQSVAATLISGTVVNVNWTDPASNETGFKFYQKIGYNGTWQQSSTLPQDTTIYSAAGLQTGAKPHFFALRAVNATGSSAWSNVATAIPGNVALNKPASASTTLNASSTAPKANNGNTADFWSATTTDSNARWDLDLSETFRIHRLEIVTRQDTDLLDTRRNFEIRASNDPNFTSHTVLGSQGSSSLSHKATWVADISALTPYRYVRVAKTDGRLLSLAEMRVFGAVPPPIPAVPGPLLFPQIGQHEIHLTWADNSTNETSFKLERKTGLNGTFSQIATIPANITRFADRSLLPGTSYFYRLRASNGVDDSAYSAEAVAVTHVLSGYELWSAKYPLFLALPAGDRIPTADPNNDGIVNLLAYALALDPMVQPAAGDLPAVTPPPAPVFQFRRNSSLGMIYQVLVSDDLSAGSWQIQSQLGATVASIPGEPGVEWVTVPLEPMAGRNFVRLQVIQVMEAISITPSPDRAGGG